MTWRILRPFVYLCLFISLVGFACGTNTPTVAPTGENSNQTTAEVVPTVEETSTTNTSSGTGKLVTSLDDVQNATIQIVAEGTSVDPQQGTQLNSGWSGSGFFIDPSGLAVTNNHVVTGAAILKAYIGGDTTEHSVRVVAVSECSDLAVVQVDATDFNYMKWYSGDIKVGMEVYAAGYPLGEPQFNLTKGIISKTAADGQTAWASLKSVIGHDATINPGNSGGPLVTTDGEVVGINYRGRMEQNQYFAIGSDVAVPVVNKLKTGTNIDTIGVNGEAFTFGPNNEYPGIWAYSVASGSVADKAGVKAGDILLEIEKILLASDGTFKEYCDVLRGHKSTDTLSLRVYRPSTDEILEGQLNGKELAVTGYGGLTSGSGSTSGGTTSGSTSGGTTSNTTGISTEFEGDYTTEGWKVISSGKDSTYKVTQKPGRLIVRVDSPYNITYLLNENFSSPNVIIKTQATKISGPNTMGVELVCRATDKGWYKFGITLGGRWFITRIDPSAGDNGYEYALASGTSKYIAVEKHTNYMEASCIGTTLTLSVNDHKIGEVEDRDLSDGATGFAVETASIQGAEIEFENFSAGPQ
jgi:S1-C subfamily serine protease